MSTRKPPLAFSEQQPLQSGLPHVSTKLLPFLVRRIFLLAYFVFHISPFGSGHNVIRLNPERDFCESNAANQPGYSLVFID
jgi:hypothetical protein